MAIIIDDQIYCGRITVSRFFHIGQHSQGGGFCAQVLYSRCLSNGTQRGWCFWICFDLPPELITSFVGENAVGFEDILYPLINFISCANHLFLHFVERSSEVITLGSRQSLCINESLRSRARGAGHLNDLCRRGIPARWKHRKTLIWCCFYYRYYLLVYVSWLSMATQEITCNMFTYTILLEESDLGAEDIHHVQNIAWSTMKRSYQAEGKVVSIRNPRKETQWLKTDTPWKVYLHLPTFAPWTSQRS